MARGATVDSAVKSGQGIDASSYQAFTTLGLFLSYGLVAVTSVVFGLLWWLAWTKQLAADNDAQSQTN